MAIVRSLCGQCGAGCGIRAITGDDRSLLIEGDRMHPVNGGQLCARGEGLAEMSTLDGRLLHPMVGGRRIGWDRAIAHVARRLKAILDRHGPGSIALHVAGNLLTEDYYAANKLMKGFFGSAQIYALWDMNGAHQSLRAAFGAPVMPAAIEDIEQAETLLLLGDRAALRYPVLMDRVQAAREAQGVQLIQVTEGAAPQGHGLADISLVVARGSMARLLTGLLLHCQDIGAVDQGFLDRHVAMPAGFWDGLRPGCDIWSVARECGLPTAEVRAFYDAMASSGRLVTLWDDGEGSGVASAVVNLHLAKGAIGRPGNNPFLLSGQANAMGGREVGCLTGDLAAHRDFSPQARAEVTRFWGAHLIAQAPGAVEEAMHAGRIKALWSIGRDDEALPWLRQARATLPFVIASRDRGEGMEDADVLLPSPAGVEKDGTLTGPDRLISRQRRLFPLPGEAKPDWWAVTKVAQAMGWGDAFHYERAADLYREHVRLTAYRNDGARLLNLKRHAPISNPAYDELTPWRWGEVPFDGGHFPTPDGRARLAPPTL
ncbi:molybdopterin-dependent oxidoreductase [Sphingobium sp.]|uniref:molybdopterin-dependent oxidoreductase n=1 Tax=Sphingobium sp. TaxID=1912891 RepID=UPI002601F21E|nr:molybdopterin-dependent oxidoreductase [Sphingobium sp.]